MKSRNRNFQIFFLLFIGFGICQNQCLASNEVHFQVEADTSLVHPEADMISTAQNMKDAIRLCVKAGHRHKARQLALTYYARLNDQERAAYYHWFLFEDHFGLFSESETQPFTVQFVINHLELILKHQPPVVVFDWLSAHYRELALAAVRADQEEHPGLHSSDFERYIHQLRSLPDFPAKPSLIAQMQLAQAVCRGEMIHAVGVLADHVESFSSEDQQLIVPFLGKYERKTYPQRLNEAMEAVIASGLNPDLIAFLQDQGFGQQAPVANAPEKFDHEHLKKLFGSKAIVPFFHPTKDVFWYVFEGPDHQRQYFAYAPERGKFKLYEKTIIDSLLLERGLDTTYVTYEPRFDGEGIHASLSVSGHRFDFDDQQRVLTALAPPPPPVFQWGISPDKRFKIIEQDYNLFVQNLGDSSIAQLTTDGTALFGYAVAELTWLADHRFVVVRSDHRNIRQMGVTNTLYQPTSVLTYEFELPGDTSIVTQQLVFCDAEKMTFSAVNADKWKGQQLAPVRRKIIDGEYYFLRTKRTRDEVELCRINADNQNVEVVIHEISKPYINEDLFNCHILKDEIIFWSDRTGWGHYYRYDKAGNLQNAITKGEWTAGKITRIDTTQRQLFLYGFGHDKGINPNYQMLYRTGMDGKHLVNLTSENATHGTFLSPNQDLLVDYYSRVDLAPIVVVKNRKEHSIDTLEQPDLSKLFASGWKMPEQFTVKAADGKTDLYGIMWKPFDFDPDKKYPIISQVYPGPQTETVWSDFTVLDRYSNTALAQRGFIVVVFGHRGGSPIREKSYASYGYGNMRDYPLADDKYGLEQLCDRFDFIDRDKIGITGHSGGGFMSVAALCTYPDFYKAAVASSGNHDNTIYHRNWGELYHGIDDQLNFQVKTNMELAENLKGKLLLVTGESDKNVHPANTYKMVDALIKAGKYFELLVLPGQGHHYDEPYKTYFEKRKRDFFEAAFQ